MASAKNKVVAGNYENMPVVCSNNTAIIVAGIREKILITRDWVESYEVVDETSRKSAASAVGRAAIGGLLLGPVGLAAGLSAKSKSIHTVAINFKGGNRSLLEVDDKIYKAIVEQLF